MPHGREPVSIDELRREVEQSCIRDVRLHLVHPIENSLVIAPTPRYEPGAYEPMPDGAFIQRWGRIVFVPWANVTHVEIVT